MKKLALLISLVSATAMANVVSLNAKIPHGTVTLKVLPAESFMGKTGDMKWDSGAKPMETMHSNMIMKGMLNPDHHMVVFIKENGKAVDNAKVVIRYRELSKKRTHWQSLPVARMHVAGKGAETTHYGNNLKLNPGSYIAQVTINHTKPVTFHFKITR